MLACLCVKSMTDTDVAVHVLYWCSVLDLEHSCTIVWLGLEKANAQMACQVARKALCLRSIALHPGSDAVSCAELNRSMPTLINA